MSVRVAAAKAIAGVIGKGESLNHCLPELSKKVAVKDQALLSELVYGSLRRFPANYKIIEILLEKPLKQKDIQITALLVCALYQIISTRIPSHAILNESVIACKKLQRPWAKGLVNAVLRRFIRERQEIDASLVNDSEYLYAHPQWLIDTLEKSWPDHLQDILNANNQRAPMTLRVNELRVTRQDYLSTYFADGSAVPTHCSRVGVQLEHPMAVSDVPGFGEGLVSVQDEAGQLAASILDVQAGQEVLDACSAPGTKTCHILESSPSLKRLIAVDIDRSRLIKVEENFDRLKLSASLVQADVADTAAWWDGQLFDRILLDAPCSATGVIRRHPDIKLLRKPADIDKLAEQQLAILDKLWPLLKVGGNLLYSTCSVVSGENDGVIKKFTGSVNNCRLVPIDVEAGFATEFGRQLFPVTGGHDGFYYAMLAKF
jgi:16S rRNA (cytosine967-C5)-methyltransferase